MGIISDILAHVTTNQTAKDIGIGALGVVLGSYATRYIFQNKKDDEYEDDEYNDE
tara:strand:+ start:338 stop:502 length:165 start_codon:yes stop_codon:yes gene_type:complete